MTLIAYFNICILWGSSNLATKIGVSGIPPLQFACLRFFVAGIILSILALLKGGRPRFSAKEWKILLVVGLLMNFLTNGCVAISNSLIDSGIVTVMMATVPIFATIIEVFIAKTARLQRNTALGLAGGFCGILIVTLYGSGRMRAGIEGIVIILFGAVFWAFGTIYSQQQTVRGSAFSHAAVETLFASALFFLASKLTGSFQTSDLTVQSMLPVLYLAVCDSVIGFVSYIYLLKVMPTTKVCTYAYINPVVALILGYIFLKEQLNPGKIFGMIVILVSVMLIQKDKAAEERGASDSKGGALKWMN